jgi:hypothetical protein
MLLALLAVGSAQNSPAPSPETPVARYLQVMSSTARDIQKGQPLYDFKVKPVKGNGMQTILENKNSLSSCASPSADKPECSVIQGLIVMPVVCIVVGFLVLIFWCAFACARRFCKCCCNNCGGRKPQPEGGKYTRRSKIIIALLLAASSCVLIAIASMAMSATYDAPTTVDVFFSAILDFLDKSTSFLNSGNTFILSNGVTVGATVSTIQNSFYSLQNTLNSSQIRASAELLSMRHALHSISSSCSNFTDPTVQVKCIVKAAVLIEVMTSSSKSLNSFQVKSLSLSNAGDDIGPKIANNTASTRDALQKGATFTSDARKSLMTFRLEMADPQNQGQLGGLVLFGAVFIIPLFFALGFMCQKWSHWYFPLWIGVLLSLIFWIILGVTYVLSYFLNNTCDLMPTDESPRAPQPLATAVDSSMLQASLSPLDSSTAT